MNSTPTRTPNSFHTHIIKYRKRRVEVKDKRKDLDTFNNTSGLRIKQPVILCSLDEATVLQNAISSLVAILTLSSITFSPTITSTNLLSSTASTSTSLSITPTAQLLPPSFYSTTPTKTILLATFLSLLGFIFVVVLLWYFNHKNQDSHKKPLNNEKNIETASIAPTLIDHQMKISPSETTLRPSSSQSSTTIRAILQDSIPIVTKSEVDDDDNQSILSIERPLSPNLASLLRAYQHQQDYTAQEGSLRSIPMSHSGRQQNNPILLITRSNSVPASNFTSRPRSQSSVRGIRNSIISTGSFITACSKLEEEKDLSNTATTSIPTSIPTSPSPGSNLQNRLSVNQAEEAAEAQVYESNNESSDESNSSETETEGGSSGKVRKSKRQTSGARSKSFVDARAKFEEDE